ncbi:Ubiquitin--protein ligase [Bertholletia excelsa]
MIQKFDRPERRFLTFPAVHPCEGISLETLLQSLADLARTICGFQTLFFATQKRNARETFRQVGILLIFLDDIRDRRRQSLPDSVVLCFTELHHTFQNLLFLLQDCTREGARLWTLMQSHVISTQFRVLIRNIATALDVLPLDSIDVSTEVRELVELVAKQSRKAKFELHPNDETATERVVLIINQFEDGFEPDLSSIKRVLDYLEIQTWSDSHNEIKFLEEEITSKYLEGDKRELPLLNSSLGFMSYCRGVIFESNEYGVTETDQLENRCNLDLLNCVNPEDFRCPISLELMTDPVTVSTGQTYDRASIQKWLKAGNIICPKTGAKLTNTELVPNSTLRRLIHQFCADNGISLSKSRKKNRDITRTIVAGSPAAEQAVKFLAEFLADRLYLGTHEQRNKAAYEIRLLAKSNIFNRACLVEAGSVPGLLNLLGSDNPETQENAVAALLKLSKHNDGKKAIVENGGLDPILEILKRGLKLESRQIAAAIFFYLSSIHEYRKLMGGELGIFPALVELMRNGTVCGKKNAVVAIFGLLLHHGNRRRALSAGVVPVLVNIVGSSNRDEIVTDSLAVLSTLGENTEGSIAILQSSNPSLFISILQSSNSRTTTEYCVSVLLSLCTNCGNDVTEILAKELSLMAALYSVLTDGTCHGSKKARSLIKILHEFRERSSSGSAGGEVHQERFVHVR